MSGLRRPTSGSVCFRGEALDGMDEEEQARRALELLEAVGLSGAPCTASRISSPGASGSEWR